MAGNARSRGRARFRRSLGYRGIVVSRVDHYVLVTKSLFLRPTRRLESCSASGGRNRRRVEEQGLGDRRFHSRTLEWLGDEEGRLGPGARQQTLREGGDEDHRHGEF